MRRNLQTLAKYAAVCCVLVFLCSGTYQVYAASSAKPSTYSIFINGIQTAFEAYNIDDHNYFKLRDVACALSGTRKQFEVEYDNALKTISLTTGKAYTVIGGELQKGDGKVKEAHLNSSEIYVDGTKVAPTAYTIEGYNFFKLRDLGEYLNFAVGYDEAAKNVSIDTTFAADDFIQSNYKENLKTQENIKGLINEQNGRPVSEIRMGLYGSDVNGCGWIAVYNAMYLLGEPQTPADIVRYYETAGGTLLNGFFGTNPITVNQYFIDMGFKTATTAQPLKMDKDIADAGVAVLEYANFPYLHYVAVCYENGKYSIYNSGENSGKPVETASIDKWLEDRNYTPLVLITVKK